MGIVEAVTVCNLFATFTIVYFVLRPKNKVVTRVEQVTPKSARIVTTPHEAFTIEEKRDPIAHSEEDLWAREHGRLD